MTEFDPLIDSDIPLTTGDAVAAVIFDEAGRYLLQLRDSFPHIWYPGHWGLFGGAIDPGESHREALGRELQEELGFTPVGAEYFIRYDYQLEGLHLAPCQRTYYLIKINSATRMTLGEGREVRFFTPREILTGPFRVTPYDSFALWLHYSRSRIRPQGG